ncbi:nitrate reductase cytochrome c-type subunit [Thiovibrio sp. JS02]
MMKKHTPLILMSIVGCLAILPASTSAAQPQSLRGPGEITAPDQLPEVEKPLPDQKPIKRDFAEQPPLIPHAIEGYRIDKESNQCLDCHGKDRATAAAGISRTHFLDSAGKEMASLAPSHYFCTLCHVMQTDARPLVENTFRPAPAGK